SKQVRVLVKEQSPRSKPVWIHKRSLHLNSPVVCDIGLKQLEEKLNPRFSSCLTYQPLLTPSTTLSICLYCQVWASTSLCHLQHLIGPYHRLAWFFISLLCVFPPPSHCLGADLRLTLIHPHG